MSRVPRVLAALAVVVASACACALAARGAARPAHPGFPILACDDPRYPYANHYGRFFRPSGFCDVKRGNGAEGIDHTSWSGWGRARATGRGYLVVYQEALGEFPARIVADKLYVTNSFTGGNEYMAAYLRLRVHVLQRRAPKTAGVMIWSGPLDLTLNVQIEE
jgi:hypothetical protein